MSLEPVGLGAVGTVTISWLKDRFQASTCSVFTQEGRESCLLTGDGAFVPLASGRPRGSTHSIFIIGLSFLKHSSRSLWFEL